MDAPTQPQPPAHQCARRALRISGFGFPSNFGFRISDLARPLATIVCLLRLGAFACGPDFPNTLLDRGDDALLGAPTASFQLELSRMNLTTPPCLAAVATNGYAEQTFDAELRDLRAALVQAKEPEDRRAQIVARHAAARAKLSKLSPATQPPAEADAAAPDPTAPATDAKDVWPQLTTGLPPEFADYFTGSVAWHADLTNEARADWEALLRRPAAARHFRSTWAAYMLGRSWHAEDPDKAIEYYQQVRALAKAGFADSLGLAAASLGWEAQARFQQKRHAEAIELYLAQLAAGDNSAVNSLRFVAAQAVQLNAAALETFAANPLTRRVLTAYVIAHPEEWLTPVVEVATEGEEPAPNRPAGSLAGNWLSAVEAAQVQDVEAAESLALAAYQVGQWDVAQRWINRARATVTTQWLQVKLLLRLGKTQQAAALLAQVARQFPLEPEGADRPAPTGLKDTLSMNGYGYSTTRIQAPSQVLGELGVVLLARREYAEALDALLRAGFWMDAAYVAERVLTADELTTYVDLHWPVVEPDPAAKEKSPSDTGGYGVDPGREIRYLLARRLARLERPLEAREYFPPEWQARFDELQTDLQRGADTSRPAQERGQALFAAAWMTRTNGLELIGTEVEPDWKVHGGDFQEGVGLRTRTQSIATNELENTELVPEGAAPPPKRVQIVTSQLYASPAEMERARAHRVAPEIRWHYRDRAALLGLQAAKLLTGDFDEMSRVIQTAHRWTQDDDVMETFHKEIAALGWQAAQALPNNSDETARVLCIAGSWIKSCDPAAADRFYKALVRRCRKTALGDLADRKRWFPLLDEQGNPLPWKPNPPVEIPPPAPDTAEADAIAAALANVAPPPAGYSYMLNTGDSLQDVADAVLARHQVRVTVAELIEANPGINPNRLKAGLKIFVPASVGVLEPGGLPEGDATPAPVPSSDRLPQSN